MNYVRQVPEDTFSHCATQIYLSLQHLQHLSVLTCACLVLVSGTSAGFSVLA